MLDNEIVTMSITVVENPIIVAPVRNPPAVAPFLLQIGVSPRIAPHVPLTLPPPLHTKPLPLIVMTPYPSNLVSDKDDNAVVE